MAENARNVRFILSISLLALVGLACSLSAARPMSTVVSPPPTAVSVTATLPLPATLLPTDEMPPPATTEAAPLTVRIFLIALEDGGVSGKPIGCEDSVVAVDVEIPHTQAVLRASLEKLLSLHDPYYGQSGLYNALYQSNLVVDDIQIENGKAIVELSGSLMLGGACDAPRVQAQLEETARQFSTVQEVAIFVNGVPLADLLSGK